MEVIKKKACNKCNEEMDITRFATFFSKSRNKTFTENRCRVCKNEAGRLLMAEKAAKRKAEKPSAEEEEPEPVNENVPPLTKEQLERKQKQRERGKAYYEKNKEALLARAKEYKAKNKDAINATRRKYLKQKMKDPTERIKRSMKTLLLAKIKKHSSSTTYFGTTMDFILKWLEFNFSDNMSWDNYGTLWQIDHTIPVNLWNVKDQNEALMCFNWKNLMPLKAETNLRKASHLHPYRIFYQEQRVRDFHKKEGLADPIDDYISAYNKKFKSLLPEFYMRHTSIAGTSSKS